MSKSVKPPSSRSPSPLRNPQKPLESQELPPNSHTLCSAFDDFLAAPVWVVAFSGGLDSSVLLHAAVEALRIHQQSQSQCFADSSDDNPLTPAQAASSAGFDRPLPQLIACHVNHHLSAQSDKWAQHCQAVCKEFNIDFQSYDVAVEDLGQGIESAARDLRYAAFRQAMSVAGTVLFTAHHSDDQAETILLKLARGEGLGGLRGIQHNRTFAQGVIARPFLSYSKEDLKGYAAQHKLQWVEDESNNNTQFDRNFLREAVTPLLIQRWPAFAQRVSTTAQHVQEQYALLDEIASEDLSQCLIKDSLYGQCLDLAPLQAMSVARIKNCVLLWFRRYEIFTLNAEQWRQTLRAIEMSALETKPRELILQAKSNHQNQSARHFSVYNGMLYAKPNHSLDVDSCAALTQLFGAEWRRTQSRLLEMWEDLPNSIVMAVPPIGELVLSKAASPQKSDRGIEVAHESSIRNPACLPASILTSSRVTLVPAASLKTIVLRGMTQRFKNLFQQHRVPHWLRDSYPVLTLDEKALAVPGIAVADDHGDQAFAVGDIVSGPQSSGVSSDVSRDVSRDVSGNALTGEAMYSATWRFL